MANLFACFKPRQAKPSVSGLAMEIAQHHSAIAWISGLSKQHKEWDTGLGVLIYPSSLLLTTHRTIPTPSVLANAEISLRYSESSLHILKRKLLPHLFFITSPALNLTVVACEFVSPEMKPLELDVPKLDPLNMGNKIYILGYDMVEKREATKYSIGSGYVVNQVADFVEVQTRQELWMEGSVGFDHHGKFAFLVTYYGADLKSGKGKGVTIQGIRDWFEPQWQAKTSVHGGDDRASSSLQPQGTVYMHRATYGGSDASYNSDAVGQESDIRYRRDDRMIDNEKERALISGPPHMEDSSSNHCCNESLPADHISCVFSQNDDSCREHDSSNQTNVHDQIDEKIVHTSVFTRFIAVGTGKPTIKKDKITGGAKEKWVQARKDVPFGDSWSDRSPRKPTYFKPKTILAVKDETKKKALVCQSKELERRLKPGSHKAFQQNRRSLQIRLVDLSK